jgi:hypothetical protein
VLLVFGVPCQYSLLAGREHGRTIPLPVDMAAAACECCRDPADKFGLVGNYLRLSPYPETALLISLSTLTVLHLRGYEPERSGSRTA